MEEKKCSWCGKTKNLRKLHSGFWTIQAEYICEDCFTPTDTGPCFDDLEETERNEE
jgi:hypothetical protein